MIQTYSYTSTNAGPTLLLLGCIHGNEKAGSHAIHKWMRYLENNTPLLGTVKCVPVCNPRAYQEQKRYIDINLNRVIKKTNTPQKYEEEIANHLCSILQDADIIIDLHTSHRPTLPYVFQDYTLSAYQEIVHHSGVQTVLVGRPSLYQGLSSNDTDTITYAKGFGIPGVTIECGGHDDSISLDNAYTIIGNILSGYGMIDHQTHNKLPEEHDRKVITMKQVWYKLGNGTLNFHTQDLTVVDQGTVIATYESGEKIRAPMDGYIILPYPEAEVGDERFYFGSLSTISSP